MNFCRLANQLEIACYVEQAALNLRWDAVRTMKAALAGTASTKFLNVFEAAFGEEDESEVTDIVPTEQEEEEDLPEGAITTKKKADTDFGESSTPVEKRKARSSTKQPPIKKSRKQAAPTKSTGPFTLKDASPVFPDKDNKASYLHTGVPDIYISQRQSGPGVKWPFINVTTHGLYVKKVRTHRNAMLFAKAVGKRPLIFANITSTSVLSVSFAATDGGPPLNGKST